MTAVEGCVFCLDNNKLDGVIYGKTPRAFIVENPRLGVPGACLIIPTTHIVDQLPGWWQEEVNYLIRFAPWWQPGINRNESSNIGYDAGQRVSHLHTHVIPRTPDQGQVGLGTFIRERMEASK